MAHVTRVIFVFVVALGTVEPLTARGFITPRKALPVPATGPSKPFDVVARLAYTVDRLPIDSWGSAVSWLETRRGVCGDWLQSWYFPV